jgi:hypothetical protein
MDSRARAKKKKLVDTQERESFGVVRFRAEGDKVRYIFIHYLHCEFIIFNFNVVAIVLVGVRHKVCVSLLRSFFNG